MILRVDSVPRVLLGVIGSDVCFWDGFLSIIAGVQDKGKLIKLVSVSNICDGEV